MWDPDSSLTQEQTQAPWSGSTVLAPGPPGKAQLRAFFASNPLLILLDPFHVKSYSFTPIQAFDIPN